MTTDRTTKDTSLLVGMLTVYALLLFFMLLIIDKVMR